MIGDVLLDVRARPGSRRQLAGFENHAGRTLLDPGAEAARTGRARLRQRRRVRVRGMQARRTPSGRTCTARCFLETRGLPTGCSRRRWRTRARASRLPSRRCPTSSRQRRSAWRRSGRGGAADGAESGITEPTSRRGRRRDRPAASAGGSGGSADGACIVVELAQEERTMARAPRRPARRPPRATRHVGGEDDVNDVLAVRRPPRVKSSRRSRPGLRAAPRRSVGKQPRLLPELALERAHETLARLHPAAREEPDRCPRFSWRARRIRPRQRRIADTRIRGSATASARRRAEASRAASRWLRARPPRPGAPMSTGAMTSCAIRMPGSTVECALDGPC